MFFVDFHIASLLFGGSNVTKFVKFTYFIFLNKFTALNVVIVIQFFFYLMVPNVTV